MPASDNFEVVTDSAATPAASVNLDDLYARNPGTVATTPATPAATPDAPKTAQAVASTAGSTAAQAANATLEGYDATRASDELTDITSQDSPIMQRAQQQGILTAASRGLQNTSIAAGAAQGAMVDRATPLALANAESVNRASEFTAGQQNIGILESARMEQEVNIRNAEAADRIASLNAQMETAVSQGNAAEANRLNALIMQEEGNMNRFNSELEQQRNLTDAAAENQMRRDVLSMNAELNRQFLAGEQAMSLADIQGRYNQLISSNQVAASLYESYFSGISQAMANDQLSPDRIAQYVNVQQTMLESGLRMIDEMNSLDLGQFTLPGAETTGTGTSSTITPTPGTGATESVPAPAPAPSTPNAGGTLPGGASFDEFGRYTP